MPRKEDLLFAKVALEKGAIDLPKVKECLRLVEEEGGRTTLSQVLLEEGYVSKEQFQELTLHLRSLARAAAERKLARDKGKPRVRLPMSRKALLQATVGAGLICGALATVLFFYYAGSKNRDRDLTAVAPPAVVKSR